jgi:predicted RecA/RadA family phage recombinase
MPTRTADLLNSEVDEGIGMITWTNDTYAALKSGDVVIVWTDTNVALCGICVEDITATGSGQVYIPNGSKYDLKKNTGFAATQGAPALYSTASGYLTNSTASGVVVVGYYTEAYSTSAARANVCFNRGTKEFYMY